LHQGSNNGERQTSEAERKVKEAARQLDHLVRAVRIEELPRIKANYESKIKDDRENYEREVVEKAKHAKEQWAIDVQEKKELTECAVFNFQPMFESRIMAARKVIHDKLCKEEDERAELEAEKGKLARARKVSEFHVVFVACMCCFFLQLPSNLIHSAKKTRKGSASRRRSVAFEKS
jgi:hypothetical protein